jgi:Zn-dependent peptidase ImmA (M78 family)
MDGMAVARINGQIISWALRRSGASLESLATLKVNLERLKRWESGDESPSEGQAEELADRLGIAYPMLYMATVPPDEPIKTPDLRTLDGQPLRKPSLGLLSVLDSSRARQNWYREELIESGSEPLPFVSRFGIADPIHDIAADMRVEFRVAATTRSDLHGYEELLKSLVVRAEELGILVMRSAVVGHATTRKLSVKEFRGFVLLDTFAPIIFVNDNDAKAAQIFTLAHELAHIWVGASGISDRDPEDKESSKNPVETKCDAIAAEFLVPEAELRTYWNTGLRLESNLLNSSHTFNVSSLVILRRAKDLNLITNSVFFATVHERYEAYKRHEREAREKESRKKNRKGNFYNSFEIRNGRKFNSAVVGAVREQRATYAEAGTLFGISPGAASRYIEKMVPSG